MPGVDGVECSPLTTPLNITSVTLLLQIKVPNIQGTREINTEESCKNLSQENQSSYSDKSNHDQENETKVPTIPNNTMNIENTAKTEDNTDVILQLTKVPTTSNSATNIITNSSLNLNNSCDNTSSMLITNSNNNQLHNTDILNVQKIQVITCFSMQAVH